jgi:hypothetical protein
MKTLKTCLFLAVLLWPLVLCCVSAKATDCMVGYWRLDEGDGATAYDSANGNDGTIYGASWTMGMVGQALNFDGDSDYINVGNGLDLISLNPAGMTIEAWVYNTQTMSEGSGVVDLRTVVGQRGPSHTDGYGLQYGYLGGFGYHGYTVTIVFFGGYEGVVDYEIFPDQWYHIVGVFEDNIATMYIDGTPQSTWQYPFTGYTTSTDDVMIGRHGNWSPRGDYHEGIIDEVAIYNCALTSQEIQQHYQNGLNMPPVADAGPDQTVEQDSHAGAGVTLDGSGSSDPDGDPLTYAWTWAGGSASGVTPTITLPLGTTTITLVVNDGTLDSDPDTVDITVEDTTPPTINSISADPDVLWPPNHKMVEVTVSVEFEDICDPEPFCYILGVSSNEPINGPGDGNTEPDWEYTDDPLVVLLRAERSGGGDGRIYTIEVECMDASGNITMVDVEVTVPHDKGNGK